MSNTPVYEGARVHGHNITTKGKRIWDARSTGVYRFNRLEKPQIEVLCPLRDGEKRWVDMSTFTGSIALVDGRICSYMDGVRVSVTRHRKRRQHEIHLTAT